ncbi:hypothetical protein LPJ53_006497, partial [Coemansia erecta]
MSTTAHINRLSKDATSAEVAVWIDAHDVAITMGKNAYDVILAVDPIIVSDWSNWRQRDPANSPADWNCFKTFMREHHGTRNTTAARAYDFFRMGKNTNCSIEEFNAEFRRLAMALGIQDKDELLKGAYRALVPEDVGHWVAEMPTTSTLEQVLDNTTARVNLHVQRSRASNDMVIGAVDLGGFVSSQTDKSKSASAGNTTNAAAGRRNRKKPKDGFVSMRERVIATG